MCFSWYILFFNTHDNIYYFEIFAIVNIESYVSYIKSCYVTISTRSLVSPNDYNLYGLMDRSYFMFVYKIDLRIRHVPINVSFLIVPKNTRAYATLLGRSS